MQRESDVIMCGDNFFKITKFHNPNYCILSVTYYDSNKDKLVYGRVRHTIACAE